jgi:1-acyl-sn-glycerol-3-phosphate acyltransferase
VLPAIDLKARSFGAEGDALAGERRADGDRSLALDGDSAVARAGLEPKGQPAAPVSKPPASYVDLLRRRILDEVVIKVLGLPASGPLRRPVDWLLRIPAQRFAEIGAGFDLHLARGGFAEAARWALPRFVDDWRALGTAHVPREGPLLVVANHPGAYDVLVVAAHLPRGDLKVVAGSISFLQSFSAADRGLIFAGRDYHARATALRAAMQHLRAGGALLTFPSETIDPDPSLAPVGENELEGWSPSIEWTLRRVPQTSVVVAIVSGVIAHAYYRHPLTLVRRAASDRRRVASLIQMAGHLFLGRTASVVPMVSFAAPVAVPTPRKREDVARAMGMILVRARHTLEHHVRKSRL